MLKRSILAAMLFGAIAACSQPSGPETNTTETSETSMEDVFAANIPWDSARENVVKTPSGLEYVVIKSGDTNGISPKSTDQVVVHYDGRLAEGGKKFDSSYDRGEPATFPAGGLIKGWVEALGIMKPGDEWMLYIPSNLGYGASGAGADIPPNADLVFRVALEDVIPAPAADEEAWKKYTPFPEEGDDIRTTPSGLRYVELASADPAAEGVEEGDFVVVQFEGRTVDTGQIIESSYMRGQPARIPAGEPFFGPGWAEIISMMKRGDRWLVYIPAEQALAGIEDAPQEVKGDLVFEIDLGFIMKMQAPSEQ